LQGKSGSRRVSIAYSWSQPNTAGGPYKEKSVVYAFASFLVTSLVQHPVRVD
jgi:hypothetical protein